MDNAHLVIERIALEESLRESANAEDLVAVESFGAESRRREVLAWRSIVRRELGSGCRIFHDEYGAPKVDIPHKYISVSHSREYVAVLFADTPCAIDIEFCGRNFRSVASRYLSEREQGLAEQYDVYAELWCAKEALYKYYSKGNIDLVNHIVIATYNIGTGLLTASILGSALIEVYTYRQEGLVVATIA